MIVWVWHCPKCGHADAIYFDEADAGTYDEPDSCDDCDYSGGMVCYEMSEDEAVEAGFMREAQYMSPGFMDGAEADEGGGGLFDEPESLESYGYAYEARL